MELTLHTTSGADLVNSYDGSSTTITGIVSGIPARERSDPFVLLNALLTAGLPPLGAPWEGDSRLRLRRQIVRPASGTNDAVIELVYEGPSLAPNGGTWAALVIEDDTTLASEITELDGEQYPIQAIFWAAKYAPATGNQANIESDKTPPAAHTTPMNVLRPRRTLSVSGVIVGRKPSIRSQQLVGTVNAQAWPSGSLFSDDQPLPSGYWLCTRASCRLERPGVIGRLPDIDPKIMPYRFSMSWMTNIRKDWSNWGIFKNLAGKVPQSISENEKPAIDALKRRPYYYGQYNAGKIDENANGIVKVGLYPTEDFSQILGF